jgi:resuscitation-promoting factor RpfA
MNRSPEPLSAEERDLAERLAKLDARREPGPALDAAILAAARAAVHGEAAVATAAASVHPQAGRAEQAVENTTNVVPLSSSARTTRKRLARLPLGLSLAASLVLAAGIGWRLADGGGSESAMEEAMVSMEARHQQTVAADSAPAAAEPTEAVMLDPEINRIPPPPPPPPPPLEEPQASVRREMGMTPPMPNQPEAKRADIASGHEHDFAMDEAVPYEPAVEAAGGSYAADPLPPPPAAALGNALAKPTAQESTRSRQREAAKEDRSSGKDKLEVVGSRIAREPAAAAPPPGRPVAAPAPPAAASAADQPFDDQPPVSADSPEFRQAWLQRIRKQLAAGQTEAGRNSLQEFRRRYPDVELPEDLKKIAATLPPLTP